MFGGGFALVLILGKRLFLVLKKKRRENGGTCGKKAREEQRELGIHDGKK